MFEIQSSQNEYFLSHIRKKIPQSFFTLRKKYYFCIHLINVDYYHGENKTMLSSYGFGNDSTLNLSDKTLIVCGYPHHLKCILFILLTINLTEKMTEALNPQSIPLHNSK